MMEHQHTKEQLEEMRAKTKLNKFQFLIYAVIGISVFSGYMYYSFENTKDTIWSLKMDKSILVDSQEFACNNLKDELKKLIRIDSFQEMYKLAQENHKEGVLMWPPGDQNTTNRQNEIRNSLDAVCTQNNKKIEEIDKELKRHLKSF